MHRLHRRSRGQVVAENALILCLTAVVAMPMIWRASARLRASIEEATAYNSTSAVLEGQRGANPWGTEQPPATPGDPPAWPGPQ